MTPGLRQHKSASCRVAIPTGVPDDMREGMRELIAIESGNPRKGHATGLLRSLCTEADVDNLILLVQVQAYDEGMTTEQLTKWYAGHGFQTLQTEPVILMARPVQRIQH